MEPNGRKWGDWACVRPAAVGHSLSRSFTLWACSERFCSDTCSQKVSSCHQLQSWDSLLCGLTRGPPSSLPLRPCPHCPRKQHSDPPSRPNPVRSPTRTKTCREGSPKGRGRREKTKKSQHELLGAVTPKSTLWETFSFKS